MTEKELDLTAGDTLETSDNDRLLGDARADNVAQLAPLQDDVAVVYDQMVKKERHTSCTKFAPINQLATLFNYRFTPEEIQSIEYASIGDGFVPGAGRSSSKGVDVVRRWRNKNKPDQKVNSYVIDIFSTVFDLFVSKKYAIGVSINVDNAYRKDAFDNSILEKGAYGKGVGHATTIRSPDGRSFEFIDSYKGRLYKCNKKELQEMVNNGNMMQTCRVFAPQKLIDMIAPDVPEGQRYSDAVQWGIDNKITSADKNAPFRPSDPITRAECMQMLYNFSKKA